MKCLSLWEPWASAMARSWKMNETRSWRTDYRGPLAIHAAKNRTAISNPDDVNGVLFRAGLITLAQAGENEYRFTHLGCILAVTHLIDCVPTELIRSKLSNQELAFGNYESGRYAWVCSNTQKLAEPIPFRGQQGLFNLPEDVTARIKAQVDKAVQCPPRPTILPEIF